MVMKMLIELGKGMVENSENFNKALENTRKSQREKEYDNWSEKYIRGVQ